MRGLIRRSASPISWSFAADRSAFSTSRLFSSSSPESCPLPFETLPYRGAEVRVPEHRGDGTESDSAFLDRLRSALDYWTAHDYTSAWVHVPAARASLVESLTESEGDEGCFDLHHVNATERTVVLKRWLRDGTEDKIPPLATHQVGCAGFVLSDENEILLVKEWRGPPSSRVQSEQWKLPGGLLDAGESFEEASCREVVEETGVDCTFESLLTFWHRHGLTFGKSDFYFVCLLRPKSKEVDIDPVEISAATWMPVEEFLSTQDHPLIHHILKNCFHGLGESEEASNQKLSGQRLQPAFEMVEGFVQWPNRQPYPTYTGQNGKRQPQLSDDY